MINLFNCNSLIQININGEYKVKCHWFCVERTEPLPYEELIKNYSPNKEDISIAERGANEFFTEEEIEQLKTYLSTKGLDLKVKKAEHLPVDSNFVGLTDFPLGDGTGNIKLSEHEGYPLSFKVWGIYDYKDESDLVC
ncbi:hypothetical protein [Desulfosporosinus sp. FKB]|uniref:hypothetical protein n=1 Tax=Desulfosporosinus sp. FKB TaxID=1969835 RepID=UPI000B496FCC|nr:hypothetical protein [Desulfosporosinus sp. FKB]